MSSSQTTSPLWGQPIHHHNRYIQWQQPTIRSHKSIANKKQVFKTYHKVDQALCNQIIAAVPDIYIRALKLATTGFRNVTSLQLLMHLWSNYGTITQKELG
jgi:hypothetical protein